MKPGICLTKEKIMKNIMILLLTLMGVSVFAQQTPVDKKEETKTKVIRVKSEKDTIETKMQVKTTEETEVRTVKNPNHPINQDQIDTPTKVTTTTVFDLDNDPFYEESQTEKYYTYNNKRYRFEANDYGFEMKNDHSAETNNELGKARLTSVNRFYLIENDGNNGIGYFNKEGSFVVEYYDPAKNKMVVKEYKSQD